MIFDDERALRTINNAPNPIFVKVFFYIAFNQPKDGIHGFKIDKKQLRFDLQLGRTIFFESLHWLKENLCIHELKLDNLYDFMANPYIAMNNSDREQRIAEWKRRIRLYDEQIAKNKERQRIKALKSDNK